MAEILPFRGVLYDPAKVHLDLFEDSVHKRALQVVADYMVSRDH